MPPSPTTHHLLAGQGLRFGACACAGCDLDVVVRAAGAVGTLAAERNHWCIGNHGVSLALVVDDLENRSNVLTVPPGRASAVVPFEFAQVSAGDEVILTVCGPEPSWVSTRSTGCPALGASGMAEQLNMHATYFAVLVALCEPRLAPQGGTTLPTSGEIALRLARRGIAVTPRGVEAHIEYLLVKLALPDARPPGARRSWRKEAVASAAIRRGWVNQEHLTSGAW